MRGDDSLIPGKWFVQEVSEGSAEILVTECSHTAKSACPSLRVRDQQQLFMKKVNKVRNLKQEAQIE